jgi:glycosyltransferase involved in cell wall biosynthesis
MDKKVFIVIAAYNEESALAGVLHGLRRHGYRNIVVVDDGSRDRTSDVALAGGAWAVRHSINRGQGAALKTGIDFALQQGADIIVTFDADGQHLSEDIPALIKPVATGAADVALGSRFLGKKSNVPPVRALFLKGGALLMRVLYGVSVSDSHNGFRAFSRKAALAIELRMPRMEHASEIIEQIGRKKLRYVEVPVTIRYTDYSLQHSSQGALPAFKILFRMLIGKFMR